MVFSSLTFLIGFLPVVLLGYYLLDKRYRNVFLLLASLFFYAWGEPRFVLIMIVFIFINYLIALGIYQCRTKQFAKKLFFILGLLCDIGLLGWFKYMNFLTLNLSRWISNLPVTNIVLPIGISFFTFQMVSYIIDVYWESEKYIAKNPINLGLYIAFFPQLIAGPIVRYNSIYKQIIEREMSLECVGVGTKRFILGLAKKVIISNNLAIVADRAFRLIPTDLSIGFAWLGALAYTLQIYFDFSGYSDMAIGLGKMFGFQFDENFNYPYTAKSITDFWHRWHISLSSWFRDYIYIPLGGDGRNFSEIKGSGKLGGGYAQIRIQVQNLFIVWLLTGIWHGASWNFVAWGLGYFVLLMAEKFFVKPHTFKSKSVKAIVWQATASIAIILLWVLFRAYSFHGALAYYSAMFGIVGNAVSDNNLIYYAREYIIFFIIAIIVAMPVVPCLKGKLGNKTQIIWHVGVFFCMFIALTVSVSYLVMGYYNPFIYFNF